MPKYYVVWAGRKPGVYSNWASAFEQVHKFPRARYKGYRDRDEAYAAFRGDRPAGSPAGVKRGQAEKKVPQPATTIDKLQAVLERLVKKLQKDPRYWRNK